MVHEIQTIINRLKKFGKKLAHQNIISDQRWAVIGTEAFVNKIVIFRNNNELFLFENGILIEKGKWSIVGDDSLIFELSSGGFLFSYHFMDKDVLVLKLISSDNFVFFISDKLFLDNKNTIEKIIQLLNKKYPTLDQVTCEKVSSGYNLTLGSYIKYIASISGRGSFEIYRRTFNDRYCILDNNQWVQFNDYETCINYIITNL